MAERIVKKDRRVERLVIFLNEEELEALVKQASEEGDGRLSPYCRKKLLA